MPPNNLKRITLFFRPDQDEFLDKVVYEKKIKGGRSEVVRDALDDKIKKYDKKSTNNGK